MTQLTQQPARIPLVDPATGLITREWYRYFQGLFDRAGGANGLSTTDVDAGSFAAMQPAASDAFFNDLMQICVVPSDAAGEAFQAGDFSSVTADVSQPDNAPQIQFWSP